MQPAAPAELTWQQKRAASPYDRKGFTLRLGVGIANCSQEYCDDNESFKSKVGPDTHIEIGVRPVEWVSLGANLSFIYNPVRVDGAGVDAKSTILSTGVFVYAHPVPFGRVDPYGGFGLGYMVHKVTVKGDGSAADSPFAGSWEEEYTLKRGYARLTGGVDFFVAKHVALGPRFSYFLPFGGEFCYEDDQTSEECADVDELDNDVEEELPRPWSVTFNASFYF